MANDEEQKEIGCCQKCSEPINNAEYDLCPQCMEDVEDYWKDVESECGCGPYGFKG